VSSKLPITVLIAAKNEGKNIGRCLASLSPVKRIIVIDSHSEDTTEQIAKTRGAHVAQFEYRGGYPKKRQWALDTLDLDTQWIFLLDADEVVPSRLWDEIKAALVSSKSPDAYLIKKAFHFLGRRFRFGGFSHSAVLLFRRGKARFERIIDDSEDGLDMEVHERLIVDGTLGRLRTPLIHEDFKGLEAYIARHNYYSTWEAKVRHCLIMTKGNGAVVVTANPFGNEQERRRFLKMVAMRIPFEPELWFLYHYIVRLGILEGRPGLIASQIRASYIAQARAKLYEIRHQEELPQ
jgi:glycosyltransferase involved in cell wall biosynthesis